jgi:hypothetical protein
VNEVEIIVDKQISIISKRSKEESMRHEFNSYMNDLKSKEDKTPKRD